MYLKVFRHWACILMIACLGFQSHAQIADQQAMDEREILDALHTISSHQLYEYVEILSSEKYEGRLTGTESYNATAQWVASVLNKYHLEPAGDDGTYFQHFKNPYTLVLDGGDVILHIPLKKGSLNKSYMYEEDYYPGSTSASGAVTAEVVYVGYGITAPELGYDDYSSVNVRGKIVMMEREVPVSPNKDPKQFMKWRPYSFHQYKLRNAVKQGARGMLYCYHIVNPNNAYDENMIYAQVSNTITDDIFQGTGRKHKDVIQTIKKKLSPRSFATGKTATIRNTTEHHHEGIGINVMGYISGNDPQKKHETIVVGGHLDHLGLCHQMMPGANDNASAVAVMLELIKALSKVKDDLDRSVLVVFFGAEEQGVVGSKFFLENPIIPLDNIVCLLNMDGVGCGDKINGIAGKRFPKLWKIIEEANEQFIHRQIRPTEFSNIARPRLDAARFMWKGIPSISFSVYGAPSYYHSTKDDLSTITPEIMEDLAQLLFLAVYELTTADHADFREDMGKSEDLNKFE